MRLSNFFLKPEDEMDFIPIIPLNEHETDDSQDLVVSDDLPVLPLRNTVLFPGVVLPITVGRDKSIKAVNEAYKTDKLVGVLAQKDSNIEDPATGDLEAIGTVAKIVKLIKMLQGIIRRNNFHQIEKILNCVGCLLIFDSWTCIGYSTHNFFADIFRRI